MSRVEDVVKTALALSEDGRRAIPTRLGESLAEQGE